MPTATNAAELRNQIQSATSGDVITLAGAVPFSVITLAKLSPLTTAASTSLYTISGAGQTLSNTRIYQQNIDGSFAPSTVQGAAGNLLSLSYTSSGATDGAALLRATSGTFNLNYLNLIGTHRGWNGNGNVYISLTTGDQANAIAANFNLTNSNISIMGQGGAANPNIGGLSAFLQSWNNSGTVLLSSNHFDEAGFKTSFHFANMRPGGAAANPASGSYVLLGNTFKRTSNATVRDRGNRLESVTASLLGNTFQDGSYLDLAGNISSITINGANNFKTIYLGTGINVTKSSSSGAALSATSTSSISGNSFTGYGLAFTYAAAAPGDVFTVNGSNTVTAGTLTPQTFAKFFAGGIANNTISSLGGTADWIFAGSGNDVISSNGGNDYIIGGSGADSISPGTGNDTILYYATTEGGDTINGFTSGQDKLAFRSGGGGPAFANTILFETGASPSTTNATWLYAGGALTYFATGSAGSGVAIANFTGSPTLVASDLVVF